MGTARVVLDTNILISALGWRGKPRQIFEMILDRKFTLVLSEKQLKEIQRVLDYPKFRFTAQQKRAFLNILCSTALLMRTQQTLNIVQEDPSDNMLIEAAIETCALCIVTGDFHLRKLGSYKGIMIVTPAQFLQQYHKSL